MPKPEGEKVMTMKEAVEKFIHDGDTVWLGGLIHCQPHAAQHEIIRQGKRNLTAIALVTDLICLVAAGLVKRIISSYTSAIQYRSYDESLPKLSEDKGAPVELEEYSNFGISMRLLAGSLGVPFIPTRTLLGSDFMKVSPNIKVMECPYTKQRVALVPALNPDVAVIHSQRADPLGNVQRWGVLGVDDVTANASKRVIASVEEVVSADVIRHDPNRTIVPSFKVDCVVEEPWGAHPWNVVGFYDLDPVFFLQYSPPIREKIETYMEEWVYGVKDRQEYIRKYARTFGKDRLEELRVKMPIFSGQVNYGISAKRR